MIIVVTGAMGFIGSNIVLELNKRGHTDIIAVDDLDGNSTKFKNLVNANILDYVHKDDFIANLANGAYDNQIDYIIHQGACSDTTCSDGNYMMRNNYEYSCSLLDFAQNAEIPFLYASSAATYGASNVFCEDKQYESPLNVYGYSKFLFDQLVRRYINTGNESPIVGLRYFNVYGLGEWHKERMASVVLHNFNQYKQHGKVKLFEGCLGYASGCQLRDFISIRDVVRVNMHFFDNHVNNENISGIFNCGTGIARSFNDLALATINACNTKPLSLSDAVNSGVIEYIEFPHDLKNKYQCYTQADLTLLRQEGKYTHDFLSLEDGINDYVKSLLV